MPAITEQAKLGQEVTFDAIYNRRSLGDKRWWELAKREERKGVVVGTRTLWDGEVYTEHFDAEDGGGYWSTFVQRDHKPAILVAFALNRKPVLVPLTHITAA